MTVAQLRHSARLIWEAAFRAADPAVFLPNALHLTGRKLVAGGREFNLDGRLVVVGAGKAAARMAQVIEQILGDRISSGVVTTKYGHALPLQRIRVLEAGHPIPDECGVRAVEETQSALSNLAPQDIVLCLISGGGSALWPAPAEGITLEEKQEITGQLLRAGASIRELNAVRKHLSRMKGGQLAQWAAPARVISLIVSDVIGDPVDFIASGPTAPDSTSFTDTLNTIHKYRVHAPERVLQRLTMGARGLIPETPKADSEIFRNVHNVILANNQLLIDAAASKARELGFNTKVLHTGLEGESRDVGRYIFAATARQIGRNEFVAPPPACILAGGETTVTVRSEDGRGGRNQEMALAWAMDIASRPIDLPACFASVASDGTDGPTDAAGGLVDAHTCSRGEALGMSPMQYLTLNDSYNFLKATGDLIVTGPTLTNLMDLQVLLVGSTAAGADSD